MIRLVGVRPEAAGTTRIVLRVVMLVDLYKWRLSGTLKRIGSVGEIECVSVRRRVESTRRRRSIKAHKEDRDMHGARVQNGATGER